MLQSKRIDELEKQLKKLEKKVDKILERLERPTDFFGMMSIQTGDERNGIV